MPSYLAALRYRVDGNALRFVSETHQSTPRRSRRLSAAPSCCSPTSTRRAGVDPYVVNYLQALHSLGSTIRRSFPALPRLRAGLR